MTGSGTFLDQDFTAAPQSGWTKKKLSTTFGGSATAGTPIGKRADGYLDPSNHPPVGVPSSKLMPDVHLLSLPNGAFENGAEGWGIGQVGSGQATIDASTSLTGVNSFLLSALNNGDGASITCTYVPCTEGVQYYVATRAKLKSGNAILYLQVVFFNGAKAYTGNQSLQGYATGTALNTSGFTQLGYSFIPPAGTRYFYINVIASATSANYTGALWIDEVRVNRAPVATEVAPYATPGYGSPNLRDLPTRFADIGVSAKDFLKGDGTLESATAVANMIAACPDRSVLFFPPGVYLFPGTLTFTDKSVLLVGAARESTTLTFNGGTDGIVFYITSDQSKRAGIRNLKLLPGVANGGTAINIRMPPSANAAGNYVYRQVDIDNVVMGTQNDDPRNPGSYWSVGIRLCNVWIPYVTDTEWLGLPSSSAFIRIDADATAGDGHYYGCVAGIFSNLKAGYGAACVLIAGYAEGLEFSNCDFVAFQRGVYVPNTTNPGGGAGINRAYALWFTQCHFNITTYHFDLDRCSDIKVLQCDMQCLHIYSNNNIVVFRFYDVDTYSIVGGQSLGGGVNSNGSIPQDAFMTADGSGTADAGSGASVTRNQGTRNGTIIGHRKENFTSQCIFSTSTKNNSDYYSDNIGNPMAYSDQGGNNKLLLLDGNGTLSYNKTLKPVGELQPQVPVRMAAVTRASLLSNFPAGGWGNAFQVLLDPVAGKSRIVCSDGVNWLYMDGTAVS